MGHPNKNIAKVLLNNDLLIDDLPGSISLPRIANPSNSNWYLCIVVNACKKDPKFVIGYSIKNQNKTPETLSNVQSLNIPGYTINERQTGNDYLLDKTLQHSNLSGFDINLLRDELIIEMIQHELSLFNQLLNTLPIDL